MSAKTEGIHFEGFQIQSGKLCETDDASDLFGDVTVLGIDAELHTIPLNCTGFALCAKGQLFTKSGNGKNALRTYVPESGWAVLKENDIVSNSVGDKAILIIVHGYDGMRQVGGPLEHRGRLKYIDGCSDSLLVCPPIKGEPCLNHLHIPPGIAQTRHTHPSDRIGIILGGKGRCITPDEDGRDVVHDLEPGMFWRIPRGGEHSFYTDGEDEHLEVMAFHPDSDFGPEHEYHPMLNRTVVDGKPGYDPSLSEIRTKEITA